VHLNLQCPTNPTLGGKIIHHCENKKNNCQVATSNNHKQGDKKGDTNLTTPFTVKQKRCTNTNKVEEDLNEKS
jgi:hypothetical protein